MAREIKLSQFVSWWDFHNNRYLFCSSSGAFVKINEETEKLLRAANVLDDISDPELAAFFTEKGILVPHNIDEFGTYRQMTLSEMYCGKPSKLSYTVAVTEKCNFRCYYCFEEGRVSDASMTVETAQSVVDFLQSSVLTSKAKELHITWFGGEPLLNTSVISYISELIIPFCEKNNVTYSAAIITNGSLLNEAITDMLIENKVSFMQVTIDGDKETSCRYKHCSETNYQRSLCGVVYAAPKIRVNVRFNTDGENIESILNAVDNIREMISDATAMGNIRYYLACIERPSECIIPDWYVAAHKLFVNHLAKRGMKDDILMALPKARLASCGAVTNSSFFICANGDIVKCEHYLGLTERRIGTVFEGLYHNAEEERFRDCVFPNKCRACTFFPICRQGCLCKRLDEECEVNCKGFIENIANILYYLARD